MSYLKTYNLPTGLFTFEINGPYTGGLQFEIINNLTQEFGYEDNDELTFYPGVLTIEISDPERTQYNQLKYNLDLLLYPTEITATINGKVFRGYIDKETLEYSESTRTTKFECVDVTKKLANNNAMMLTNGAPYYRTSPAQRIYEIWKKVYPTIPCIFSESEAEIINSGGFYWKHDWQFISKDIAGNTLASSSLRAQDLNFPSFWTNCVIMVENPFLMTQLTDAEYLKFLAREFGMVIGTMGYNQVYVRKRYTNNLVTHNLIPETNIINYTKTNFIKKVVSCKNHISDPNSYYPPQPAGTNNYYYDDGGYFNRPLDKDIVLEITTYLPEGFGDTGVSTLYIREGETRHSVFGNGGGVRDPELPGSGYQAIGILLAYWNWYIRKDSRDKYEIEVKGIDYDLHKYYKFMDNTMRYLRPIRIVKDYINNKSTITGIQNNLT